MAHLPHFVQVGQPGGVCGNGVHERAIVGHRVGAAAEGLSVKAAVKQPLAPLGRCLPCPHNCIKQRHLRRKASVSRSIRCLCYAALSSWTQVRCQTSSPRSSKAFNCFLGGDGKGLLLYRASQKDHQETHFGARVRALNLTTCHEFLK